jgi:glc operon protein GlcG
MFFVFAPIYGDVWTGKRPLVPELLCTIQKRRSTAAVQNVAALKQPSLEILLREEIEAHKKVRDREDALASTRDACATQKRVRSVTSLRLMGQMKRIVLLTLALSLSLGIVAEAQLPVKKVLSLEVAKKIAAAAEAEAKKRGATVVIVVVDDGGHLLLLERLDDTQVASVEVGIGKARTAAIFRRPSKVFEDQVREGRVAALALPGATPLQGGVPIVFEGKVIGAIGVSGNTPQEDEDIAKVGAASAAAAIGQ